MTLGVTVGKFYPFHTGHDLLLREARRQVDHLVVIIGYQPEQQLPVETRMAWIRERHLDVEILPALEDIPEAPEPWAERTLQLLAGRRPDVAFTSEDYGIPWAAAMGARHVPVDPERVAFPISGTELRADLSQHWNYLTPPAKAYFARRVSIVGVESSGTTTLAQDLARHFRTVWVPEYGRAYWEGRQYSPGQEKWDSEEFLRIARAQAQCEEDLARRANRLVICDTDPLATHVWHRRFLGSYQPRIKDVAQDRHYDLTFITLPDFDFVQDGTREGEAIRHEMHEWFRETQAESGRRTIEIGGRRQQRLAQAVEAINPLLNFPTLAAP